MWGCVGVWVCVGGVQSLVRFTPPCVQECDKKIQNKTKKKAKNKTKQIKTKQNKNRVKKDFLTENSLKSL